MIKRSTLQKLVEVGIQLDMIGQPLKVGDTILTKSYGSPTLNCFATIKKINKKSILVDVNFERWDYGKPVSRPPSHTGYWDYYPNRQYITGTKPMKRVAMDCLKISPEQQAYSNQREQELFDLYPELFI